jgi:ssDNA-binding Zn-finger/Zn-ribbon topoisomerase 1
MSKAPVTKHECARCGKHDIAERMVYSTHTRNRYCRDFGACDRRLARKARA